MTGVTDVKGVRGYWLTMACMYLQVQVQSDSVCIIREVWAWGLWQAGQG